MLGIGMGLGLSLLGNSFSPASRSPLLWVRSDKLTTTGGGNITAWGDLSGNGNNFGSGTNVFHSTDATLNNAPSVGTSTTGMTSALIQAQPNTTYIVGHKGASGNDFLNSTTGRTSIGILSSAWYIDAGSAQSGGTNDASGHAFCCVYNGASADLYVDNSGSPVVTTGAGSNGISTLMVGGAFAFSSDAGIAEIIVIAGADTVAQVSQMFRYFSGRGLGVTAS